MNSNQQATLAGADAQRISPYRRAIHFLFNLRNHAYEPGRFTALRPVTVTEVITFKSNHHAVFSVRLNPEILSYAFGVKHTLSLY